MRSIRAITYFILGKNAYQGGPAVLSAVPTAPATPAAVDAAIPEEFFPGAWGGK